MSNILQQAQEDMYARLAAATYFNDIGIFLARPRAAGGLSAIQTKVDEHLAGLTSRGGKRGIVAIVTMPSATAVDQNVPGPRLTFNFMVRVIERPQMNMGEGGTLKPAEEVALEVVQLFHHFKLNRSLLLLAAQQAIIPVDSGTLDRVIYDCRFEQTSGLAKPAKVAAPTISPNGGAQPQTVTIECATVGATIKYSIDGSYPSLPYSAPVEVASACLLRAVADLANHQQSDISEAIFT